MVKRTIFFLFILAVMCISAPSFAQVYEEARERIVSVSYAYTYLNLLNVQIAANARSSGVVISPTQILTVHHLGGLNSSVGIFSVAMPGGLQTVRLIRSNPELDLCLLETGFPIGALPPIQIAEISPMLGDPIFWAGFNNSYFPVIRFGRFTENHFGTMLFPIFHGDSGGGCFNEQGELIGIIYTMYNPPVGEMRLETFLGFAVSLEDIKGFLDEKK